jgi:hypothetical protein
MEGKFINGELERMGKEVAKVYIITPSRQLSGETGYPRKDTSYT